jgi:hypothetical protein
MTWGLMSHSEEPVQLQPGTLAAYAEHVATAQVELFQTLQQDASPLWCERSPERAAFVRSGRAEVGMLAGSDPIHVPDGLLHDWIGAVCIRNANVQNTLALVQSYDQHHEIYAPEVIGSRLIARMGDTFEIYLRLRKKKIMTVVLDTDHHVEYGSLDGTRWYCRSDTTRVAEVHDAGKETEKVGEPDTGYGFLWRLWSHWRFEEKDGSVWVECRAISLTRDVPKGLRWIVEPIVKKLPRESLVSTLEQTRRAYELRFGAAASALPPEHSGLVT